MRINKVVCDKCRQEVSYLDLIEVELRHKKDLVDGYDLCPVCQAKLEKWIMSRDNS